MQDFNLMDKMAHFARERIPERAVHAKGAAAHGFFEVTDDVSRFTKANFLNGIGKRTPLFLRFSTVAGERGANDCDRDPRGFAIKFYTEEGNYDMVGNNTPVFFVRDPIKFPDFIHSQKRDPQTGMQSTQMAWDFWSYTPEALHQIMILFSDRGTPYGYRHMNGYSSHTYKWVNAKGEPFLVKYHFKTDQGIKNFMADEAAEMGKKDKDFSTRDLFENIEKGNFPSWTFYVQAMPLEEGENYKWDAYDITKVWPQSEVPLIKVGKLTLNRNPENFHAETEQSAFSPAHFVPGIEASNCKMLQGRLVNYSDTHRHRLGSNHHQIPINCPYRARLGPAYNQRDGTMNSHSYGKTPNYEPSQIPGPREDKQYAIHAQPTNGPLGRYAYQHPNDMFEQPRTLFNKVFDEGQRKRLMDNIAGHMSGVDRATKERQLPHFFKVDPKLGAGIAERLGMA